MIFFKPKKIVLDCFTDDPTVFDFGQPKPASALMPQWWRDLPKDVQAKNALHRIPTIKRCVGVHEWMKNSLAVPMWCDLAVELGPVGSSAYRYQFAGSTAPMVEHPAYQRGDFLPNTHYQHIKIVSPWKFKCKEDLQWMLTQATWSFEKPDEIIIPPGMVDFKHQADVNVNVFFVRKDKSYVRTVPHGQPLIYVTPLSERAVEPRLHLVGKDELERISRGAHIKFIQNYSNIRKSDKERTGPSACPWGFTK